MWGLTIGEKGRQWGGGSDAERLLLKSEVCGSNLVIDKILLWKHLLLVVEKSKIKRAWKWPIFTNNGEGLDVMVWIIEPKISFCLFLKHGLIHIL